MPYDRLIFYPSISDLGIYAVIRSRDDGTVWNGSALANWSDASMATYDVALAYLGGDAYGFSVPADLPTGTNYTVAFYKPAVLGTPAITDVKLSDEWEFLWTGNFADSAPIGAPSWELSDYQGVIDEIGLPQAKVIWDIDNDGEIELDAMQRDGETADAQIYSWAANKRVVVPFTVGGVPIADVADASLRPKRMWRKINTQLTIAYGVRKRASQENPQAITNQLVYIEKVIVGDPQAETIAAANLETDTGIDYVTGTTVSGFNISDDAAPTAITGRLNDNTINEWTLNNPQSCGPCGIWP
jgi:hypothetical protein